MAEMVTVAAEFTMIMQADSFYISGADWVGILGMAYENIAAVSFDCECTCAAAKNC